MKKNLSILLTATLAVLIFLDACRKPDDMFTELERTDIRQEFDGSFAAPLIDTEISLIKFIPENEESSFRIETDENNLIHLRMTGENLSSHPVSQIFPSLDYPLASGTEIPVESFELQSETSDIEFGLENIEGSIFIADPRITLKTINEIPIVSYYRIDSIVMRDVNGDPIIHTEEENYTLSAPENIGETAEDSIVINKERMPGFPDAFHPIPNYMRFLVTIGNPEVQTLPYDLQGTETMSLSADIDIPTDLRIENLTIKDTMNFIDFNETEQIQGAELKIKLNNGLPLGARMQMYLVDSTQAAGITIVDSLFTDTQYESVSEEGWLLEPAETDAEGFADTGTENFLIAELDKEKVEKLKNQNATKLILSVKLNTYDSASGTNVKIQTSNKLGLKIAVKLDFAVNNQ